MYDINFGRTLDEIDDTYFLKYFSTYSNVNTEQIIFTYENQNSPNLVHLKEVLKLEDIRGEGNDNDVFRRVCNWVYNTLSAGTNETISQQCKKLDWNTLTILQQVKDNGLFCDCGTFAIVLTEVLLALGYKARWVQCLPLDLRYSDSHCVTHVYSKDFGKWMIVDAALNQIYFNRKGIPLSLPELRQSLLNDERILFLSSSDKNRNWLLHYWKKNIFRFHCFLENKYGFYSASNQTHCYLDPENFKISNKMYQRDSGKICHIHTSSPEEYWK